MRAPRSSDLFDHQPQAADELPDDLVRGLELLATSPPVWPIATVKWLRAVADVKGFAVRWGGQARALGWSALSLYGMSATAPWARLSDMGAAWLLARSGHHVTAVAADAIEVTTWSGAKLRIYKTQPGAGAVLAWSLCKRAR